ncbi:type II secretion system major pseudopilin GspG [Sandaracinobacteroides hominis]|uniref:type II secretion system major pseudopilin GspG n=1 Tax=Sandaracinobacteroides hominis TaxID=2780086 RepID=UPI0018F2D539|nr:type II secretion system major pseudopilin GspG [Sandaracinobacteroides hominis]
MSAKPIRPRPQANGFTLVELLVVLAIIGLLTTVVVLNVLPMQSRAQVQKAEADIAIIEQGLEFWRIDTGRYPTAEEGLAVLVAPTVTGAKLKNLPNDPWGKPYGYVVPGANNKPYAVISLGADGVEGGEGENADLRSDG